MILSYFAPTGNFEELFPNGCATPRSRQPQPGKLPEEPAQGPTLAVVGLITPHAGLLAMQQIGHHRRSPAVRQSPFSRPVEGISCKVRL